MISSCPRTASIRRSTRSTKRRTPVSIVLALDASGSMRKTADAFMAAARTFVEALRPEDKLSLLFFSDGVLVAHDLGTNRQTSLEAIDGYKPVWRHGALRCAGDAFATLKTVEGRRAVVVMTDGRDENNAGTAPGSRQTLAEVLEMAREVDATVLPIGLGTNLDRAGLERLADISGGLAHFPSDASELHAQFARTIENLRRRYVLGYTSTHIARDGSWRNVEIKSRSANHVIRSRSGYFARKSKAGTSLRRRSTRWRGIDGNDGIVTMSEESPKIVNMDTPELAAFFSESEFPSESELASMPAPPSHARISAANAHSREEPNGLSSSAAEAGPPAPQDQPGGRRMSDRQHPRQASIA